MSKLDQPSILDMLKAAVQRVLRRRSLAIGVAWTMALISAIVVPLVPQRFEATARLFVDTQSVLKPLMAGLAYQPDADQQVKMLAQTVISRPNLEAMLSSSSLGGGIASPEEREATITRMMSRIVLAPASAGLYAISFRDDEPERAKRVVEAVVDMFMRASNGDKLRDSEDASRFINEQISVYETKLTEAENRLKEFKVRNFGVTGVSNQDYFARMSVLSDELNRMQADLRAAEQARDAYRRELSGEDPQLPSEPGLYGLPPAPPSEVETAIAAQKKVLSELLRRYTELHPDVVATKQQIAGLEAQHKREKEQTAEAGKRGAATSPVYQRIRVALAETEAQVASLRSRVTLNQQRLDQIRSVAGRVPQVEAELAQLNRDYDVIRKNYELLVSRRETASLGIKVQESSQLTTFRVVEPARVSPRPVFPGRTVLALGAVVLSLLAGLLAPTALELLRPTLDDARATREFTHRPVIGMVSEWLGSREEQRRRTIGFWQGTAVAALLLTQAGWLGWIATHTLGS